MNKKNRPGFSRAFIILLAVSLGVYLVTSYITNDNSNQNILSALQTKTIKYDEFMKDLKAQKIEKFSIQEKNAVNEVKGVYRTKEGKRPTIFETVVPNVDEIEKEVYDIASESKTQYDIKAASSGSILMVLLTTVLPLGLLIFITYKMFNKVSSSNSSAMQFGETRAKVQVQNSIRFVDVAGYDEEKQELIEVVEFLKNPTIFSKMGAKIPRGILLVGPPGTGKTLIARAVAGEAKVPFYSISGSEFVEMYVGVGASRVRSMFKEAKKNRPCIIFIDEIDTVGRRRGNGIGGGNDEREQTLNQLLVELDGFEVNSGVIVIAATNRSDVLDPAILRPGRFDRQVQIGMPDLSTRQEIIKLHAAKRKLKKDIDLDEYARATPGFSGADLENVMNEAAIVAVRSNKKEIDDEDIREAIDRVIAGPAKLKRKYTDFEKNLVSYHETGHVIIGLELEDADEVQKVTIVPRGDAGGYAISIPKEERFFTTKKQLLDSITGLLAGRAAEEIYIGEISTGAHNDFERATKIARAMVTEYGMTDLGIYQYNLREDLQNPYSQTPRYSSELAKKIDDEINRILDEAYTQAKTIIQKRSDDVELIAKNLKEVETLNRQEIDYLLEHRVMPEKQEAETYTQEELDEIEYNTIKEQFKVLQANQRMRAQRNPEIKVYTDEEIEELAKNQQKAMQRDKIKSKGKEQAKDE